MTYIRINDFGLIAQPYLGPLLKHAAEVSKTPATGEISKDLPEELLWVHAGAPGTVVLLLMAGPRAPAGVEARHPVRVVLLPLHLVAQHLHTVQSHATGTTLDIMLRSRT